MTIQDQPTLLLIDIQEGLDDHAYYGGNRNQPDAEKKAAKLLNFWRQRGLPVIHVKHNSVHPASPLFPGKPGNAIKHELRPLPHERLIEKSSNSAFIGTGLRQYLDHHGITHLVVAGLTTEHCVSATVRMAGDLGYTTFLVADATAAFEKVGPDGEKISAETMHGVELACLQGEFATVAKSESIIGLLS